MFSDVCNKNRLLCIIIHFKITRYNCVFPSACDAPTLTKAASENVIPASVVKQTQDAVVGLRPGHLHKINSCVNPQGQIRRERHEATMRRHVNKML